MTARAQFSAALWMEWLKFRRARPVWFTSVFLVVGVPAMTLLTLFSVQGANPLLAAKGQAIIGDGGWDGIFAGANTIIAVGGLLGFGVVAGWVFGREFTDGTAGALFLTAVSRTAVATAKLVLLLAWAAVVALALTGVLLGAGLLSGAGSVDAAVLGGAGKFLVIVLSTALLAAPAAWAAVLGRGYLAAIGLVIGIVVLAQMAVMAGAGGWFPFSAPGLWAAGTGSGLDPVTAVQLLLIVPVAALFAALTLRAWNRLSLDR